MQNQQVSKSASHYNVGVPDPTNPRSITRTETVGFVVIVLVILAVILIRWGGVVPWSAR